MTYFTSSDTISIQYFAVIININYRVYIMAIISVLNIVTPYYNNYLLNIKLIIIFIIFIIKL